MLHRICNQPARIPSSFFLSEAMIFFDNTPIFVDVLNSFFIVDINDKKCSLFLFIIVEHQL
jgi:hypothetical protein